MRTENRSSKSLQKRRNTSINVDNTFGAIIKKNIAKLNTITNKQALEDFMTTIRPEVSDTKYFEDVMIAIQSQPFQKGYKMLYDIYLKGEGISMAYYQNC